MFNRILVSLALLVALTASQGAFAGAETQPSNADQLIATEIKKSFRQNSHLKNAEIDTRVLDGVVSLSGTVWKPIERDLAGEIAKGTQGVRKVKNEIVVKAPGAPTAVAATDAGTAPGKKRNAFARWADDASTTAAVKSRLLANRSTKGLKINVDTANDVVTLRGEVGSAEERDLAELIAKNTSDVVRVDNQLKVTAPAADTAAAAARKTNR